MAHGCAVREWGIGVLATGLLLAPRVADPATPLATFRPFTHAIRTMGTYANVTIMSPDSVQADPDAQAASSVFFRVDSLLTNWTTTSEVARVNRVACTETTPVHPELATVLAASLRAWQDSDHAFDITVEPLVRLWGFLGGPRRVPS